MRFLRTYYAIAFRHQVGPLFATFVLIAGALACLVARLPVRETMLDLIGNIEPAPLVPPRRVIVLHVHKCEKRHDDGQ